jgi:lysophospholipase
MDADEAQCAMLQRSLERTKTTIPEVCNTCFKNYCWNGTLATNPVGNYEPPLLLANSSGSPGKKSVAPSAYSPPVTWTLLIATVIGVFIG